MGFRVPGKEMGAIVQEFIFVAELRLYFWTFIGGIVSGLVAAAIWFWVPTQDPKLITVHIAFLLLAVLSISCLLTSIQGFWELYQQIRPIKTR